MNIPGGEVFLTVVMKITTISVIRHFHLSRQKTGNLHR